MIPPSAADMRQAAGMMLVAAGASPDGTVTDHDSFAKVAMVRDGLLAVVEHLDASLARYAELVHAGHDAGAVDGCYVCELQRGDRIGSVTMRKRWAVTA